MKAQIHIPVLGPLKDYITAIFEISGQYQYQETILPKGVFEMVFNLGGPMNGVLPFETEYAKTPKCFVQGIHTQAIQVSYTFQQHLFCIQLRPHKM